MANIGGKPVDVAAARLREHLSGAAGKDGQLSRQEVDAKLGELAPSEAGAVDAFYRAVQNKLGATGQISLDQIDAAIASAKAELGPVEGSGQPLSPTELEQLSGAGRSMIGLARKLRGERGAVLDPIPDEQLAGLKGEALRDAIRQHSARHIELGYREAREVMFADIDNRGGEVQGVYTGRRVRTRGIPEAQGPEGMNTEHTRPKSRGVRGTAAVSDLHHLFPTDSDANARRSSIPFGEVVDAKWTKGESKLGYDRAGNLVFEPPDAHKGDVARSQFYVSSVYGLEIPQQEEAAMRAWHRLDPVSPAERQRNDAISAYQENRNPFVDHPELADEVDDF